MGAAMKLGQRGLALIKAFESFVPHPYDDALPMVKGAYREWKRGPVFGTLTIGYGHTEAAGPPKISRGMRLSETDAALLLDADLDTVEHQVNQALSVDLSQHQFDALVSFHFNTGAFTPARRITKLINEGFHADAMKQLLMFRTANGKVLRGLERRRAAEKALFEGRFEEAEKLSGE